ncbi:hypothetical protein AGLY_005242, partial [Aphis glycines]
VISNFIKPRTIDIYHGYYRNPLFLNTFHDLDFKKLGLLNFELITRTDIPTSPTEHLTLFTCKYINVLILIIRYYENYIDQNITSIIITSVYKFYFPKPPIKFPRPPPAPCCNCRITFCNPGIPPKNNYLVYYNLYKHTNLLLAICDGLTFLDMSPLLNNPLIPPIFFTTPANFLSYFTFCNTSSLGNSYYTSWLFCKQFCSISMVELYRKYLPPSFILSMIVISFFNRAIDSISLPLDKNSSLSSSFNSFTLSMSPSISPIPSNLETNGFVLNGSKSSICSPVPIKIIGLFVAATLAPPPFAWPSSLVITTEPILTLSLKARACPSQA